MATETNAEGTRIILIMPSPCHVRTPTPKTEWSCRLRQAEQLRIFQRHTGRRIVLATNVAETSLTVPGIHYVIDTGLARISRYSPHSKVQRLPIEAISQASANQRKGRCGRLAEGICIRLYAESDFASRPAYTDPEILRTNLASIILRMRYLGLGDIAGFPFLQPPAPGAINDGFRLLVELKALDGRRQLTVAGRQMARLPVDPKYAAMLVAAHKERCLEELLIIVSALSSQDPREQDSTSGQQAQQRQQEFRHESSDFLGFVMLWQHYEVQRQQLTQNQLRKFCQQHHLSFLRMREWRELHRQLLLACQQLGFRRNLKPASYGAVHRAIISGSLQQIAVREEGNTYRGSRNRKFRLLSGSVLGKRGAKWIVTGEQIETSSLFAALAAKIEPEWVEDKAGHLLKRQHSAPHWSRQRQAVFAWEKVSLYGLVIIEKKAVPFAPIDPAAARTLFIQEGLAADEVVLEGRYGGFLRANRAFLAGLAKQEEKIRKPEYFVSESDIAQFYEASIPAGIASTAALRSWLQQAGPARQAALTMDRATLFGTTELTAGMQQQYPDQVAVGGNRLDIEYRFEPGLARDGATVNLPVALLPQISQADVDWMVPGLVAEKCTVLIKALPKSLRKHFIPISAFVAEIVPQMLPGEMDFVSALSAQIRRVKQLDIAPSVLRQTELPAHLRIKVRVEDQAGRELAQGEDIAQLQRLLAPRIRGADRGGNGGSAHRHPLERDGCRDWPGEELPETVRLGGNLVLLRYPALMDQQDSVAVRLYAEKSRAERSHREGLIRLYQLRSSQQQQLLEQQFSRFFSRKVLKTVADDTSAWVGQAVQVCYGVAFGVAEAPVRNREAFCQQLDQGKQGLLAAADELETLLEQVIDSRFAIQRSLQGLQGRGVDYLLEDVTGQLRHLFGDRFLVSTPWNWLQQFPRYLRAVLKRLEKAPHVGPKDRQYTEELASYWRLYARSCDPDHMQGQEPIDSLRWMIEEYRVSLFAQALGTRLPVSAKRLDKAVAALRQ